jgi:hypothetical protein
VSAGERALPRVHRGRGVGLLRPAVASASLLVVLLPALWVGSRLDLPPAPGEVERIVRALSAASSAALVDGEVARQYHAAAVAGANSPTTATEAAALLSRARLGQVAVLAALSGLVYLCVLLARGRVAALCSCLCLGFLAPIAAEGHVLRPEAPAALFAALALLLWQSMAPEPRVARRGRSWRQIGMLFGLGACAVIASGLCVAALPSAGEVLLVPGIVLTLAALQMLLRTAKLWRRCGLWRMPVPAINRRLLPWTALALATPAAAWWLLSTALAGPVEALRPTASSVGLLPSPPLLWWPFLSLLLLGAGVGLVRVGVRFGRSGRIRADFVLAIAAAVWLAAALRAPHDEDQLPAVLAAAVCAGDGLVALLALLPGLRTRPRA